MALSSQSGPFASVVSEDGGGQSLPDINTRMSILSMEVQGLSDKLDDVLTLLQSVPQQSYHQSSSGSVHQLSTSNANLNASESGGPGSFRPSQSVRHSQPGGGAALSHSTTQGGGFVKKIVAVGPPGAGGGRQGIPPTAAMRGATMRRRPSHRLGACVSPPAGGDGSPSPTAAAAAAANALQRRVSFSDPVFGKAADNAAAGGSASRPPTQSRAADGQDSESGEPASSSANAQGSHGAASGSNTNTTNAGSLKPPQVAFGFNTTLGLSSPIGGSASRRSSTMEDTMMDGIAPGNMSSFEVREDGKRIRRRNRNGAGTAAGGGMGVSCNSNPGAADTPKGPSFFQRKLDAVARFLTTRSLSPDTWKATFADFIYILITLAYALFSISVFISPVLNGFDDKPPKEYLTPLAGFSAFMIFWTALRPWVRIKRGAELVDDPAAIREEYFKSIWFVIDVLNVIPLEFIFVEFVPLAFFTLVARHAVLGCIRTVHLSQSTDPLQPQPRQWVLLLVFLGASVILGHFTASMYWRLEITDASDRLPLTYTDALYYAVATLTSTGYGDLTATTQETRTFSSVMMVVGVALISSLTAIVTSVLTSKDVLQEEQDRMRRMMGSMLRHYQIPFSLQREVISHFPTVLNAVSEQGFSNMIQQLPSVMEAKIKDYLRAKLLRQVPLFAALPPPEEDDNGNQIAGSPTAGSDAAPARTDVILELSRKLKVRYTEQWEYVISTGETGEEMYILVHGAVDVLIPTGGKRTVEVQYDDGSMGYEEEDEERHLTTLRSGSFFGEIALIEDTKRTASIQAIQVCELLVLSRADLNEVTVKSPELQQALAAAVKKRRDEIAAKQNKVLTKMIAPALQIGGPSNADGTSGGAPNPLKAAALKVMRKPLQPMSDPPQLDTHDTRSSADSSTPDDDEDLLRPGLRSDNHDSLHVTDVESNSNLTPR